MPRYGNDQCEECGSARVSGSKLCAGCLVRQLVVESRKRKRLRMRSVVLLSKVASQAKLIDELTKHGFKQNQEIARLYYEINELKQEVYGG